MQQKQATELERGDVVYWKQNRVVVIESSQEVKSAAENDVFGITPAARACSPRVAQLTEGGRVAHSTTFIVVPRTRNFMILGSLDLDKRGATVQEV